MKGGVKEFKKAYKHVNIDDIEVGISKVYIQIFNRKIEKSYFSVLYQTKNTMEHLVLRLKENY